MKTRGKIEKIQVVKASAGSGKTTDLSKRTIGLLHQAEGNILAVTFTNDAAQEMYNRVQESLLQLTREQKGIIPQLVLRQYSGSPEEYKKYLLEILRRPQRLRIMTIDSFFTRILRAIPIELELGPQYTIQGEEESALLKDEFIREFFQYFQENNIFGIFTNWKYYSPFRLFLKNWKQTVEAHMLPLYDYLHSLSDIPGMQNPVPILEPLFSSIEDFQERLKKMVPALYDIISANLDGFNYQGNINSHILPKLKDLAHNLDFNSLSIFKKDSLKEHTWFKKGVNAHPEIETVFQEIRSVLRELYYQVHQVTNILFHFYFRVYLDNWDRFLRNRNLLTFDSIQTHVYSLTRQYSDSPSNDKFMFINDLFFHLDGDISHFLFDEFQDTDSFQWMFFWLLIEEILSQDNEKTLYYVGDPKQSLYRFRGAVPELFDLVFHTLKNFHPSAELVSLDNNYRSEVSLLAFFNDFFGFWGREAPHFIYSNQLKEGQNPNDEIRLHPDSTKANKLSTTQITVIPPLKKPGFQDDEEEENPFAVILQHIQQLITEYHYQYHDIAVLSYTKKELQTIGSLLRSADINYVIDNNPPFTSYRGYHIITAVLSYAALHSRQSLLKAYYHYFHHPDFENSPDPDSSLPRDVMMLGKDQVIEAFQKAGLTDIEDNLQTLEEMVDQVPLDALIRTIIRFFKLPPPLQENKRHLQSKWNDEQLFLLDFMDFAHQYSQQYGYELMRFLGNLERHPERFTTITRVGSNRVRLYTIHKSKGLQFPIVLYFYKPDTKHFSPSGPQLQYFYQEHDLESLPLNCQIPLQRITGLRYPHNLNLLGKEMFSPPFFSGLHFREDIEETLYEKKAEDEAVLEELNKCYVACTRAQKGLFIYYQKASDRRNKNALNLIEPYLLEKSTVKPGEEDGLFHWFNPDAVLDSKTPEYKEEIITLPEIQVPPLQSYISELPEAPEEPVSFMTDDIVSLGSLVHFLMQEAVFDKNTCELDFQEARKKALLVWGISLSRFLLAEAMEIAGLIQQDPALIRFFDKAEQVLREAYFIYRGKNHFIDCLFIMEDKVVIVDYKVTRFSLISRTSGEDRQKYVHQLERYIDVCCSYPGYKGKQVESYLLNIVVSESNYHWIEGPKGS